MDPAGQHDFDIRLGWGPGAIPAVCPGAQSTVVVDVLSFTTAVDIAVGRGAFVHPLRVDDPAAVEEAVRAGAVLAGERGGRGDERNGWTLSPASLLEIPAGTRLALRSPNGATVSAAAAEHCDHVLAASLRNASAVAAAAAGGGPVAVIAAGERWPEGQLRVAVEDLLGAGAVVSALLTHGAARPSPEAQAAAAAHAAMSDNLEAVLMDCVSGRELVAWGYGDDVRLAAKADVSTTVPRLRDGAFGPEP